MKCIYVLIVIYVLANSAHWRVTARSLSPYLASIRTILHQVRSTDQRSFGQVQRIIGPVIERGQQLIEYVDRPLNDTKHIIALDVPLQIELVRNESLRAAELLRQGTMQRRRPKEAEEKPERIDLYTIFASMAALIEGLPNVIYCNIFVCKKPRDTDAVEPDAEVIEMVEPEFEVPDDGDEMVPEDIEEEEFPEDVISPEDFDEMVSEEEMPPEDVDEEVPPEDDDISPDAMEPDQVDEEEKPEEPIDEAEVNEEEQGEDVDDDEEAAEEPDQDEDEQPDEVDEDEDDAEGQAEDDEEQPDEEPEGDDDVSAPSAEDEPESDEVEKEDSNAEPETDEPAEDECDEPADDEDEHEIDEKCSDK